MMYIQIRPFRDLYHEMVIRWTPWNSFFASSNSLLSFVHWVFQRSDHASLF